MSEEPAVIHIDLFNVQVAVFPTDKARRKRLRRHGLDVARHSEAAYASAHRDEAADGQAWFSMVLKKHCSDATVAHECVHIADFLMDRLGIPTSLDNTEIRAYLVGYLYERAIELATWRKEAE